jgi:hypothetical protein|tara:strand:- start:228 stop:359 length:132 start_codon:yes stop_codon:yes gene_type:complete
MKNEFYPVPAEDPGQIVTSLSHLIDLDGNKHCPKFCLSKKTIK